MKHVTIALGFLLATSSLAHASACAPSSLSTYLNNGDPFSCTEGGGQLTISFNHDLLASYAGLSILGATNTSILPGNINVIPGNLGLEFDSSGFTESSALLSAQSELVHFLLDGGSQPITDTTFTFKSPSTGTGISGLGTGILIGQELVCVGGTFTSLPTGLVTSVANGVLGTGAFGCNGTALVGTAETSSGLVTAITSLIGFPSLLGVTDQATIQLAPYNATTVDVIKLQALLSITGGTVSDAGFGNSYSLGQSSATPEPASSMLVLGAILLLVSNRSIIGKRHGKDGVKSR